jgi:SAM-dependent methyltransferase
VAPDYAIGSDPTEQDRLAHQGRVLAPATRMLFEAAGIGRGMRVLDLGSGAGDVSLLAAELVGPTGAVVGMDQSPAAVAAANARAYAAGSTNVRFVAGDIREPSPDGPFDAIVGRLVLMYVDDPAAVLRTQATTLRPGGLVAPIEIDVASARSIPPTPLVVQAISWITDAFARAGVDAMLGPRLWAVSEEAGLEPIGMLSVQPHFGPRDRDGAKILAGVVGAVFPLIERTGTATADEVDVATIEQRLADELAGASAVFAHPALVCAWATPRSEPRR